MPPAYYEGNAVPAVLTAAVKDDKIDVRINIADGAFEMGGVGTRAARPAN